VAVDRRSELVDAGVRLALTQRFQDLLESVDTRSITDEAGVTTGSFFHHFRNRARFAEAVVDRFVQLWDQDTDRALRNIEVFTEDASASTLRSAAESEWSRLDDYMAHFGLQHLLWCARDQVLSDDTGVTGGDVLGTGYRSITSRLLPAYERALKVLGREPLPPFDMADLAITLHAVADGLEMRRTVDAGSVRPHLYADLTAALVIALTRPVGERAEPTDLAALERELSAGRTRPVRTADSSEDTATWRQIADAAAPLFVDRLVSEVRVVEVARVAGVSPSTVYHHFGTVSAVAAAGWARRFPELERISTTPYTSTAGPLVRLEQVLSHYVELGQANRGALEGLLLEVLAESGPQGARNRPRSIRTEIPLPSLLIPHVQELRARGQLRRRIDSEALARSMLQLVSMRILMAGGEPVERIIDETLGLLLEGALVRTAD
jgi:AcrR family transcriptional regulator